MPEQAATVKLRRRIDLEIATLREANQVVIRWHYLHRRRTMAQLPYWITLDGNRVGVMLFALPRVSAPLYGHEPLQILEMARLWIHPSAQGCTVTDSSGRSHSLPVATCAIGKALRRVRRDWSGKYPHLPGIEACVSWSDDALHEGTIYRASNFLEVGKSSRRSRTGSAWRRRRTEYADLLHPKTCYLHRFARARQSR